MIRTGFIGLGAMGLPMAVNLHKAGLLTGAWNRKRARADTLAEETGCTVFPTPADLAEACEAVVVCVSADRDLMEIVSAMAPGLSPGDIVLDCSTVDASTAQRAAAELAAMEVGFLDCPVSGGTEGARQGTLSIMVGGDTRYLELSRPVLAAMGRTVIHMGPAGAGQAAKATNQIMVAGINQAVTEALAFARSRGLPMEALIEALSEGAAGNWFLSHRGPTMVNGQFPLGFKVTLHQKDLGICADMAADQGVRLPIVEMTRVHYDRLIERGFGDQDISSLFVLKQELFEGGEE